MINVRNTHLKMNSAKPPFNLGFTIPKTANAMKKAIADAMNMVLKPKRSAKNVIATMKTPRIKNC